MREAPADNIFGKILKGEIPSTEVYSDNHVYCFLDLYPQNPGHTLVIPRNYSANVVEADESDVFTCLRVVRKLIPAVKAATGAAGVSVLANMGRDAGQMVEYLHFHIIPRHPGDSISMYELGEQQTPEQLAEMAARIRAEL
ncbi:HIT family protein [bacterium]|nr:HIT family protein [bacterium]